MSQYGVQRRIPHAVVVHPALVSLIRRDSEGVEEFAKSLGELVNKVVRAKTHLQNVHTRIPVGNLHHRLYNIRFRPRGAEPAAQSPTCEQSGDVRVGVSSMLPQLPPSPGQCLQQ